MPSPTRWVGAMLVKARRISETVILTGEVGNCLQRRTRPNAKEINHTGTSRRRRLVVLGEDSGTRPSDPRPTRSDRQGELRAGVRLPQPGGEEATDGKRVRGPCPGNQCGHEKLW